MGWLGPPLPHQSDEEQDGRPFPASALRFNQWLAEYVTHRPPRIPLDGVRMAKHCMYYDNSKAVRELGLPQTPIEIALEKAVKWFRTHAYA